MSEERVPGAAQIARVALVQLLLLAFCWAALGILNARGTWLLAPAHAARAADLFRLRLPLLGLAGAVLIPAALALRLVRDASVSGLLDRAYVESALALPARSALAGLFASVVAFNVAAFDLRRTLATPALEAAKISSLGLLTGTLFAVLSYFALQPVARVFVDHAMSRGGLVPDRPAFPIRNKVLACSLAVAVIVAGLFGLEALAWSQRYVEERAMIDAQRITKGLADGLRERMPQNPAAWRAFLARVPRPRGAVVFVTGPGGNLMALAPERVSGIEGFLLNTDFFSAGEKNPRQGEFITRWGDVRAVSRVSASGLATVGAIVRPDPSVLRGVLKTQLVVGAEALVAALLLAWAAGRAITDPVERLWGNLERFAAEPGAAAAAPVVTDDEISRLAASFESLEAAVRAAQARIGELSRKAERESLLARVAHEVRNPLFGIQSTLEALQMQLGEAAPPDYFQVLRTESARLSRLVEQMLGDGDPGTPLADAVADAERLLRARVPGRAVRLAYAGDEAIVKMERGSLVGVLADLLEAALRGREDETAVVSSALDGAVAVVRVPGTPGARDTALLERSSETLAKAGGALREDEGDVIELRIPLSGGVRNP